MKTIKLGQTSLDISRIGLGCMGMSFAYGKPDRNASFKTLETALEIGVNFFDTSDFYGFGDNEEFLGTFLKDHRDQVVLATKCGIRARDGNPRDQFFDTSPDYIRKACEASLMRLGIETIDLYYLHRLDEVTPIEDSMGALADLAGEGKIRAAGLSEVKAETIKKANEVFPVAAVQNEYSLMTRDADIEAAIEACGEVGATFVPYSPISRGLLTGGLQVEKFEASDFRNILPRFQKEALDRNNALVAEVGKLAAAKGATPVQMALAWVLARAPYVAPIPGTRKPERLKENAAAADIELSAAERQALSDLVKPDAVDGARYGGTIRGLM